jgi:excisionase family DNA binding protein
VLSIVHLQTKRTIPVNIESKKLLTVDDVSQETGFAPPTIRQMARERRLPGFKIGREFRFEEGDIARLLLDLKQKAGVAV